MAGGINKIGAAESNKVLNLGHLVWWWGKETALDQHLYNLYNSISPPSQSLSNLIEKKLHFVMCLIALLLCSFLYPIANIY